MVILKESFIYGFSHDYAVIKMSWKNGYFQKHGYSHESKTKRDSPVKLLKFAIERHRTVIPPYLLLQMKLFIAKYDEYWLRPYYVKIEKNIIVVYKKGKIVSTIYIDFNKNEIIQMPQLNPF